MFMDFCGNYGKLSFQIEIGRFVWHLALKQNTLLRVIPTMAFQGICSDIYVDIYSDVLPNIASDTYSGILSDIYSDISGILSDILFSWGSGQEGDKR